MEEYRSIQHAKYLMTKENENIEYYKFILSNLDYDDEIIVYIYTNKLIEKIQTFFRNYRLSDKQCDNLEDIYGHNIYDIIKIRINNNIFGYHYLQLQKHFDIKEYSDIKTKSPINYNIIKKINQIIKNKSKYKYEIKNNFTNIKCIYESSYSKNWEFNDILNLFESRGKQTIKVPQNLFNQMLSFDPDLYAIEILTNDSVNTNRSYCTFDDFPLENYNENENENENENQYIYLPLGVYNQLKISPNNTDFKIRIIKPEKGTKIKLKCFIDATNHFEDVKTQLTSELNKHKILSLNQIIGIETDKNHSIIPFLVTELFPNNIIDITDIDLEIDFDECFPFDDSIESLLIYLQSN